jgi:hypothetical protein
MTRFELALTRFAISGLTIQLHMYLFLAERQGFEPWEPCGSVVFKTTSFSHSLTSPYIIGYSSQLSDLAALITTMIFAVPFSIFWCHHEDSNSGHLHYK